MPPTVRVQTDDFSLDEEMAAIATAGAGALASFVGLVRSDPARPLAALLLEHYPRMTERAMAEIGETAMARFGLLGCTLVHRVGRLAPGARIVLVLTAAPHRAAALDGAAFLIDWLKTRAPFWKKECFADGKERWVEARAEDDVAAGRWTTIS